MATYAAIAAGAVGAYVYAGIPRNSDTIQSEAPAQGEPSQYSTDQKPFCTTDLRKPLPIRYAKGGVASKDVNPAKTVTQLFQDATKAKANEVAFRVERPIKPLKKGETAPPAFPADQWTTWTYDEYYQETAKVAKAFIKLGLQPHDAVAVYGFNSPEWIMSEMACIMAGGTGVGIYPTDTVDQLAFKLKHSGSTIAVCGDEEKFNRVAAAAAQCEQLKAIVCYDYDDGCGKSVKGFNDKEISVYSFKQLVNAISNDVSDKQLEERVQNQDPGMCCVLIYTSGTTGNPKAVMISHDNIIFESAAIIAQMPFIGNGTEEERILSYLPLTHVAGFMVDVIMPLYVTATRAQSLAVSFARIYDLKAGSLKDRLVAVKPTIFLGVPRVWEKIAEKMKAIGAKITGLKKKLSTWAKAKGLEHQQNCQLGGSGAYPPFYGIAEKIVLGNVKKALGLDKCKFGFTGAAPITTDTLEYFGSLGIQINEVYGMSENCGAATWSRDDCHIWGSCGYAIPGTEVKILKQIGNGKYKEAPLAKDIFNASEDEQGEICYRGRHIMMGYMANPKLGDEHVKLIEKKTAGAIDENGWLHSEDKGCKGTNGFVKITGRYKELIIGAAGENIAPVPIEDNIKKLHPAISNCLMIGDKKKFNVMLVTLKAVGATGEKPGTDNLDTGAIDFIPGVTKVSEAMKNKDYIKSIEDVIKQTNNDGKCCPMNAAKVQKFTILPRDFSVETEELTPTLKTKRSIVEKLNQKAIDALYQSKDVYVPYVPN
eukprot:m.34247 g.34247  ORF g.34247 m.34247 type:complete len:764 (-) comp8694_c0_seq1:2597-4888(-)